MSARRAADEDVADESSPRESTHFVVRAAQGLGALTARRRTPLTVVGTLLAVGVLVLVLAGRWGQFASAAGALGYFGWALADRSWSVAIGHKPDRCQGRQRHHGGHRLTVPRYRLGLEEAEIADVAPPIDR
jgi:hypothetical protein